MTPLPPPADEHEVRDTDVPHQQKAAADELDKAVQFLANHIWEKSESFSYDDDEKRAEMLYARKFMAEAIAAYSRTQMEGALERLKAKLSSQYWEDRTDGRLQLNEAIDAEIARLRGES